MRGKREGSGEEDSRNRGQESIIEQMGGGERESGQIVGTTKN